VYAHKHSVINYTRCDCKSRDSCVYRPSAESNAVGNSASAVTHRNGSLDSVTVHFWCLLHSSRDARRADDMTFFPELVIETCRHDRSPFLCSIPEGYTKLRSVESNTWRRLFSLPITGRTFATLFPVAELYVRAVCSVSLKVNCSHTLSLALRSTEGPTDRYLPIILIRYEGWNFNSGNYLFTTDTK